MSSLEAPLDEASANAAQAQRSSTMTRKVVWLLSVIAILAGSYFRFNNLGWKVSNCDEQMTRIQLEGATRRKELVRPYDDYVKSGTLLDKNHVLPDSSMRELWESCCDKPHLPPLYFLLGRYWALWFGTSLGALRSFPAAISLLQIPFWYLLGIELFASASAGAIIAALGMVSPYHLALAQYGRPYSLWIVLTLLSSILLLRATRTGTRRTWIAYAAFSTLNLYTHLSALRSLLSDVLFCVTSKLLDRRFKLLPVLCAAAAALILYIPWLHELQTHLYAHFRGVIWFTGETTQDKLNWSWLRILTETFVDIADKSNDQQVLLTKTAPFLILALVVVFFRSANRRSIVFLVTTFATSFLTLAVPDLLWGGGRTMQSRYMIGVVLSLQCMIGFALSSMISSRKKLIAGSGIGLFIGILAAGIISCRSVTQSRVWWHGWGTEEITAGKLINKCRAPILLGWKEQGSWENQVICLADELRPDVTLAFSSSELLMPIPDDFSDIFLWKPTPEQIEDLRQQGYTLSQPNPTQAQSLWKLTPP